MVLPPRMSPDERRILMRMHHEQKMQPAAVAKATGRSLSAVCRLLARKKPAKPCGRKKVLKPQQVDRLQAVMKKMITEANGEQEVTMEMVKRRARCSASLRTISRELHKRDVYFRRLRSKPKLTPDDIKERFDFAKKYKSKSKKWWNTHIQMFIDNKSFPVYLTNKARAYGAQRAVRGAYRQKGQGLDRGYTKASKTMQHNPCGKSLVVAAGVGKGRVLMWHVLKKKWSGAEAADMYTGPMSKALKKAYPLRAVFKTLEDNDPTGYRSKKGLAAKKEASISEFRIPPRSPDLNVLDYAIWAEVLREMRKQEAAFPKSKKESRDEYVARLAAVAKKLPKAFIEASVGDMQRRCKRLYEKKGYLFEEGGRGK